MSNADPWANKAERWLLPKVYHDVAAVIGWKAAVDLGMWVYETRRPPSRQMRRNGDRRGCLSVPKGESTSVAREIAVVIGADNARDFQKAFCGETLHFGTIEPASIPRRNRAIVEQVDNGSRIAAVAASHGLSEREIRRIYYLETGRPLRSLREARDARKST